METLTVTVNERLSGIVSLLPDDAAVTLSIREIRSWLGLADEVVEAKRSSFKPDLTVEQVAKLMGKSPSTVRNWFNDGLFPEASKWGKEWRISEDGLHAFQQRQREKRGQAKTRVKELTWGSWKT
jgi:excisionase family DNA binding protein